MLVMSKKIKLFSRGITSLTVKSTLKMLVIAALLINVSFSFANTNKHPNKLTQKQHFIDPELKSKEVSVEIKASKNGDVYVENTSRSIEIKTWDQPKVKVVTTLYYEGDASKLSDEDWFEKLNISVKSLGNSIRIKSGTVSSSGSYQVLGNSYSWSSSPASGVAIFNDQGETVRTKGNTKRVVTIYLPQENKVDIESKYADLLVSNNLNKLSADITNGNLETQDVLSLQLRSKYANVSVGNVKTAEVEFINGRFTAKDMNDVDIDTKYSTIEIASTQKINLISTNDEYEIDEVGSLQGRKNYGNLRISRLTKSFEMDGTNADIKVKNIASTLTDIKLDNKYADMRLPLRNLKSYTVNYSGPYSTVYSNFEKKPLDEKELNQTTTSTSTVNGKQIIIKKMRLDGHGTVLTEDISGGSLNDRFSATVGDGKGATISIKCQNCTVDFK